MRARSNERGKAKSPQCKRGHDRIEENTDKYGRCKICVKEYTAGIVRTKSQRCTKCGGRNYSRTGRTVCAVCLRGDVGAPVVDKVQQNGIMVVKSRQMDAAECIQHLADFARMLRPDFGEYTPPIHYTPGTPEFKSIARLYA
jgi:hypothetical protein